MTLQATGYIATCCDSVWLLSVNMAICTCCAADRHALIVERLASVGCGGAHHKCLQYALTVCHLNTVGVPVVMYTGVV